MGHLKGPPAGLAFFQSHPSRTQLHPHGASSICFVNAVWRERVSEREGKQRAAAHLSWPVGHGHCTHQYLRPFKDVEHLPNPRDLLKEEKSEKGAM